MVHSSVLMETPCEFINITPVNPLISKCEIKVCYVGENPNRNKSIITKEVAREMANSLPGSPIVGYYNEAKKDFEEHNRVIEISGGKIQIKDTTRPYGFVDLGARVWFQKFMDDGVNEHEYLMTEGYLWTGQYPESKRIIEQGNNHSMELDEGFLDATWTKDSNGKPKFFIINEAIISKLCVLGQEEEPCFEGSTINAPKMQFSFDEEFKTELFSMMKELKELIKEGGTPVFTTFAVEIGDALWSALYSYLENTFPRELKDNEPHDCYRCPMYSIDSIWEEGTQKFAILRSRENGKLFRLNFSWTEEGFNSDAALVEVEKTYVPVVENPTFSLEDVEKFETEREQNYAAKNKKDNEENKPKTGSEEEKCPECGKPKSECTCEDEGEEKNKDKKNKYSLDEIPEYIELQNRFSALETENSSLKATNETLENELVTLREFKSQAEKTEKQAMIDSFYMLSNEDKADVINNIDTYSIDDIEAKLSIICVRNKVSFNLEQDEQKPQDNPTVYNVNDGENDYTPAWIKSLQSVAKDMK